MEKKKRRIWPWVLLAFFLILFYRNSVEKKQDLGQTANTLPSISDTKTSSVSDAPDGSLTTELREYPDFIPEGALVIDGTEESREYDYLIEKAFEERTPDFWLKNKRFDGTMDILELNYGCFWVQSWTYSEHEFDNPNGTKDYYQHLYITYYDYSDAEIVQMKADLETAAYGILSQIPDGVDTWQKVKTIHDQLCASVTYDHSLSQPHIYDAYGAIVRHQAVCAGYASAFNYLLRLSDVASESSYSDSHAWTHVWMWSPDSYVDATWDDTDMTDRYGNPYILYDYFLITFDEMRQIDSHAFISDEKDYFDHNYDSTALYNSYHYHEGLFLNSANYNDLVNMLNWQLGYGNLLTVRFLNEYDYLQIKSLDQQTIGEILYDAGYDGTYYVWTNDVIHTISICQDI